MAIVPDMSTIDIASHDDAALDEVNRLIDELLGACPHPAADQTTFAGEQFDRGLAWVHFPVGLGGLDLSPKYQPVINGRLFAAGATNPFPRNPMGYGMCGPTIVEWGTPEQKQKYLRRIFTAEDIWCQLFSEPGAGSDVAGLATMAVPDGDEWVLNGQKVWTSLGHRARWGLIICRTDPEAVKHAGITAFVVDMHAPGVDVRPLRQMTGGAEFNEVYFTDVKVPSTELLGRPGDGWRVSLTTLMNERTAIGGATPPRGSGPIASAVELWRELPAGPRSAAVLDRLMQVWIEAEVIRLNNMRASNNRKMGVPGPEGSIGKLASAENNKRVYEVCMDLLGANGLLSGGYDVDDNGRQTVGHDAITRAFLRSRANSIEGGTSEVLRNILGERVLGLPGDVRVDRGVAWNTVPRG
ncbi:MAG: Acyl-CoA dehydrogenase [Ilumatobacteraceae bacterium]|nr:Acyl-CoA dehydrogenase [Ilumatobacteraceae bacterium]